MVAITSHGTPEPAEQTGGLDAEEAVGLLLRDLRASHDGLSSAEAQHRALQYGSNQLHRRAGMRWPAELAAQLTHPLALLLWAAAGLSFLVGNQAVGVAVLLVIGLNAGFALAQELQAERAVEALAAYLPQTTTVLRDGHPASLDVSELVPGDIVLLEEGERIPADVRLVEGALELDMSTLTGESAPVMRSTELVDVGVPRLSARDLAFMGATCTEGDARAVVFSRPPRPSGEGVIRPPMLIRAWLFLGVMVAGLELCGFVFVLLSAGWHPGAQVGTGHPLHHAYLEATTMSFVGLIAGQIGTAFAVRAGSGSVREAGAFTNRYLLAAVAGVIVFAGLFVYAPPLQRLLATVALSPRDVLFLLPYPFVVWGADEGRRWFLRRPHRA